MKASRSLLRCVSICGGMAVFLAACTGAQGANPSSSNLQKNDFGKADGKACVKNGNSWWDFVCEGHPPKALVNGLDDKEVIKWFEKLKWEKASASFEREPDVVGQVKPEMRIQAIREPQRFRFADHDENAYVLARIIASPVAAKDRRYKIGGDPNSKLDNSFYIVARGFIPNDTTPPKNPLLEGPSRPISKWTIYGIERDGGRSRLVEISSGTLRWCLHGHGNLQKNGLASFQSCKPSVAVRRFAPLEQTFEAPAWFTCGIGCCIADYAM